jgi:hypothetical protein
MAAPSVTAMLVRNHAAIDPSSGCASFLFFRHAREQPCERRTIYVDRHRTVRGGRQLEHRPVQPLVTQHELQAFRTRARTLYA